MLPDELFPEDVRQLLWHVDPTSRRYVSRKTCGRAAAWLNTHEGPHEVWLYRPGPHTPDGRFLMERRWIGRWDGVVSLPDPS